MFNMFSDFYTDHKCDRQTDRQDCYGIRHACSMRCVVKTVNMLGKLDISVPETLLSCVSLVRRYMRSLTDL